MPKDSQVLMLLLFSSSSLELSGLGFCGGSGEDLLAVSSSDMAENRRENNPHYYSRRQHLLPSKSGALFFLFLDLFLMQKQYI